MDVPSLLCDSLLCRLCAEENKNGATLFPVEENQQDLSQLVNKYLPLKIERDGKFPAVICPGCNIQLEATKQFLDLIVKGQHKLRELFRVQQETLRRQEKERQQLENAFKNVNPKSSVETFTIHSDETGEKYLIQIFSEGPLFPPEHEMSLRIGGLERPKRKRGRPPKQLSNSKEEESNAEEQSVEHKPELEIEEENDFDADGRRKRKIKVPTRYLEAVQGKELDRIFKEEGVIDEDSLSEDESVLEVNTVKDEDEIIGHLESKEGEELGELVIVNKNTNRIRIKNKEEGQGQSQKKRYECEICKREFLHLGRYEVHKSFHKNVKYVCHEPECQIQTDTKLALEQHQKETGHAGITVIESIDKYGEIHLPQNEVYEESETSSNETSEVPETDNVVVTDVKAQTKTDNKFTCEICSKTFSCKQNYEVHWKAVHENQRPYQCEKCDKTFPYLNSLKCHMLQHSEKTDKMYSCEICNKLFNHPSSLVYHREAEHNNGRRFVCNKCNKSFKHKQLLQRHQLVHSDERPHICKSCDASFKTRANLLNHMPIHTGEKKYFCPQCAQTFAHKTSLTLHTRWHSGQKPYECDVCMKMFSQKGNLAEHRRIHTGEKPYSCDHCGRKFTTSSQFKLHIKRHTGERPWRCEYCSKSFLHKDTWKCHTRRHRNERPYQCQHCMRGFTEQWALKKHERLHSGEKPYVCDVCNKGFADCSNLTKHKKIHLNGKLVQNAPKDPPNIKVMTTPGNGNNSVLYLTYQDNCSNDGQPQTLVHIMDPLDSLPASDNQSNNLGIDTSLLPPNQTLPEPLALENSVDMSLDDGPLQLQQVIDQEGNPVSLTTSDGQQIKVVTSLEEDEQNFQGLMPDGTLVPINFTVQNSKAGMIAPDAEPSEDEVEINIDEVNDYSDESATSMSPPGADLLENNIQFLTEDGENVCFVATYNMDDSINPQYLTMA